MIDVSELKAYVRNKKQKGSKDCACGFPAHEKEFQTKLGMYSRLRQQQERMRIDAKSAAMLGMKFVDVKKIIITHNNLNKRLRDLREELNELGPCEECAKTFKPNKREVWHNHSFIGVWLALDNRGQVIRTSEEMGFRS